MTTLKLEIVTPEEKIYRRRGDGHVAGFGGSWELPKHVPLLTTLVPGELRVLKTDAKLHGDRRRFVEIRTDAVRF
ncbi:MAG: hypothetical protein Udaeo2_15500 [Candidatus Udaeobacter sp.]|nr:MAG: hypothetical protein Udaeo2_15500 [Candidatus Udaeobacter sp.]